MQADIKALINDYNKNKKAVQDNDTNKKTKIDEIEKLKLDAIAQKNQEIDAAKANAETKSLEFVQVTDNINDKQIVEQAFTNFTEKFKTKSPYVDQIVNFLNLLKPLFNDYTDETEAKAKAEIQTLCDQVTKLQDELSKINSDFETQKETVNISHSKINEELIEEQKMLLSQYKIKHFY